jgi:Putative Flp pilus-assembly TadE/G-like
MTNRIHCERGQAVLLTVLFLIVLLGATTLTIDVGAWYREQRQAQATADQAVLSGAQTLPVSTTQALADTQTYADKNGGTVVAGSLKLLSGVVPNDTVAVTIKRPAPGFFSSVLGIGPVTVQAKAAARAGLPTSVIGAAPIVVNKLHPLISGPGCPCFNQETTLPLDKQGAPGAFGFVDFDNTGSNGNPPLSGWISNGYPGELDLGLYDSDPGAKMNGVLTGALNGREGTDLLFPVFDTLGGTGSTAQYDIIGWIGFHLDCFGLAVSSTNCQNQNGNNQTLTGYFTKVIWEGLLSSTGSNNNEPDYGVYSVNLVN